MRFFLKDNLKNHTDSKHLTRNNHCLIRIGFLAALAFNDSSLHDSVGSSLLSSACGFCSSTAFSCFLMSTSHFQLYPTNLNQPAITESQQILLCIYLDHPHEISLNFILLFHCMIFYSISFLFCSLRCIFTTNLALFT